MLRSQTGAAFSRPNHAILRSLARTLAVASFLLPLVAVSPAASQHAHHGGGAVASSKGTKPAASGRSAVRRDRAMPARARHARGTASDTPATREFAAAHDRMMREMHLPYTGDPDVDFRVHMIPHHQGAIDMAEVVLRHSKDPWTRQLAEAVIVEQKREIAEMQAWLARRGARVPPGGQTTHVISSRTYQREAAEPGGLDELVGKSWRPGTGVRAR